MFPHKRLCILASLSYPRTSHTRVVHPDRNLEHLRDISATQDCAKTLPSKHTLELLLSGEVGYSESFLVDTVRNNGRFEVYIGIIYIGIMADANNAFVANNFRHRG